MVPNPDASVAAIAKLLGISPSTPTPRGDNPDGRTAPVSIPSIGAQQGESSPVAAELREVDTGLDGFDAIQRRRHVWVDPSGKNLSDDGIVRGDSRGKSWRNDGIVWARNASPSR
jgi:hypothetical protein